MCGNDSWEVTVTVMQLGLCATNLVAFFSWHAQFPGLISSRGISPVRDVIGLSRARGRPFSQLPTVFWICQRDWFISAVCLLGEVASLLAPLSYLPYSLAFAISAVMYLSLINVSQPFMGLQMHANLVETNALFAACALFMRSNAFMMVFLTWILLFRTMFGGAVGKLAGGDRGWREMTAMCVHYWTQPLPNPLSPTMHALPQWFHKFEAMSTLAVEGPLSFLVFVGGQTARTAVFVMYMSLLLLINATGNFGHLGLLVAVECCSLLNDESWTVILRHIGVECAAQDTVAKTQYDSTGVVLAWIVVAVPYALVSLVPLSNTFYGYSVHSLALIPIRRVTDALAWVLPQKFYEVIGGFLSIILWNVFSPLWEEFYSVLVVVYKLLRPFKIINYYVKFGSMTTFRWEIIVEGSIDGVNWSEYIFKYKPTLGQKRLAVLPFHMPSLDWQLWFLPLRWRRDGSVPEWFLRFVHRLLLHEPDVLNLLADAPFAHAPKFIRVSLWEFRYFTGPVLSAPRTAAPMPPPALSDGEKSGVQVEPDVRKPCTSSSKHNTADDRRDYEQCSRMPSVRPVWKQRFCGYFLRSVSLRDFKQD